MTTRPDHYHMFGYMDKRLPEDQLFFKYKLNSRCDELAKAAVDVCIARSLVRTMIRHSQLLPLKNTALLVKGRKVNGDISDTLQFAVGKEEARYFLTIQKDWSNDQFNHIDWKNLHLTLKGKADGYKTWISKQMSVFCDTRVMFGHYSGDPKADIHCLNYGCKEKYSHLCICPSIDCTRLPQENVEEIKVWLLERHKTEPQLIH